MLCEHLEIIRPFTVVHHPHLVSRLTEPISPKYTFGYYCSRLRINTVRFGVLMRAESLSFGILFYLLELVQTLPKYFLPQKFYLFLFYEVINIVDLNFKKQL